MQIAQRADEIDLEVRQTAKRVADRRDTMIEHRRVRDHDDVGGEQVFVVANELVEMCGADFLLSLDHELHVDGKRTALFEVRLDRLEMHEPLALVVSGSTRVDLTFSNRRLE